MADPYLEGSDTYLELAVLHCYNGNHSEGLKIFEKSLFYQDLTIRGYVDIKIATTDIIDRATFHFAESLVNAGICAEESGDMVKALEYTQRAYLYIVRMGCVSKLEFSGFGVEFSRLTDISHEKVVVSHGLCQVFQQTINSCSSRLKILLDVYASQGMYESKINTDVGSDNNTPPSVLASKAKVIYKRRKEKRT